MVSTQEISDLIKEIQHKINHEACDYVMSMAVLQSTNCKASIEETLSSAFEKEITITNLQPATNLQISAAMEFALTFTDHSPAPYMGTREHRQDVRLIKQMFSSLLYRNTGIYKFDIPYCSGDGHPFYPIFWDFSYCIRYRDSVIIFVASASD